MRCLVFGWPQNIVMVPGPLPVKDDRWVPLFSSVELGTPGNGFP